MPCNTAKHILTISSFHPGACATKLFNCLFSSSKEFWDYKGDILFFVSEYREMQRHALTSQMSLCFAICDDLEMFPSSDISSCAKRGLLSWAVQVGMVGTGQRSCDAQTVPGAAAQPALPCSPLRWPRSQRPGSGKQSDLWYRSAQDTH